jgi:cyclic pyranopterin phosphate synthase
MAFFVDMPLCTTTGLPDFNRGYVEAYAHVEPPTPGGLLSDERLAERRAGPDGSLAVIKRSDLDDARREKRAECARCRYHDACEGVWVNYLSRYGWDEFITIQ